jgi:hypothetical protein
MSRPYFGVKTKGAAKERREGEERGRRRIGQEGIQKRELMEHCIAD